jgi:hypothetical protein
VTPGDVDIGGLFPVHDKIARFMVSPAVHNFLGDLFPVHEKRKVADQPCSIQLYNR